LPAVRIAEPVPSPAELASLLTELEQRLARCANRTAAADVLMVAIDELDLL
jgi:hypothetical protein